MPTSRITKRSRNALPALTPADARRVANELAAQAESARWEALSPAERAEELRRKALRARRDADLIEQEAAEEDAGEPPIDEQDAPAEQESETLPNGDKPAVPNGGEAEPQAAAQTVRLPSRPTSAMPLPVDTADAIRREFEGEQQRDAEMSAIATEAEQNWGVKVDLPSVLRSRMSPMDLRHQIINARAAADEALPTVCTPTSSSQREANSRDGWDRAIRNAAERHGFKAR